MTVRVAGASETEACERVTIERGTPAAKLMARAGESAANEMLSRCESHLGNGIAIYAGLGNNGGDGWIVAGAVSRRGVKAHVIEIGPPRTAESKAARQQALESGVTFHTDRGGDENLIVDALLGTGTSGVPRGEVADMISHMSERRATGAKVVALDIPSGLDATTGCADGAVVADMTISFGTLKRGELISRRNCGDVVVLDIGLEASDEQSALPLLIDREWIRQRVPPIPVDAHKGTRGRLSIVGGGPGMAGAAILSAEGALRSGIGLVRVVAAAANAIAVHSAVPAALFQEWPATLAALAGLTASADVIAIGPGLGNSEKTRDLVERVLLAWSGPVVIDADGLNIFAGDLESLATLLHGRDAIITPHPAEMARLIGVTTEAVLENRFDIGIDVAARLGCAVLLKGTPTVVFSPHGGRYVSAAGTAALATGGSGDVLTGIASTLLVQMTQSEDGPTLAAACAAFTHGRAAELCGHVRGTTLDDVLQALPIAWNERPTLLRAGILAELPVYR